MKSGIIQLDVPNLTMENLQLSSDAFEYVIDIQIKSNSLPISLLFNQNIIIFNSIDADSMREFIINQTIFNLSNPSLQTKEMYFLPDDQTLNDLPKDTKVLVLSKYFNNTVRYLDFSNLSLDHLESITIIHNCTNIVYDKIVFKGM